jgi:hypothetical protein
MFSVYTSYNRCDDVIYAGLENGDNPLYFGTTDDRDFNVARQYGKLEKHTLMRFDNEHEARTAETFIIKYFKTHGMKIYNRNEGGGGNEGSTSDFRFITKELRTIVENIVSNREFPKKEVNSTRESIQLLLTSIKEGKFPRINVPLNVIDSYTMHQIRKKQTDHIYVDRLANTMEQNPAKFREETDPLLVVVDDRKKPIEYFVNGGNHRSAAAKKVNWLDFPCVFVNYSLLDYNIANLEYLGVCDNLKNNILELDMNDEDLRYIIEKFHNNNPNLDPNSLEFELKFKSYYSGLGKFSAKQISGNLRAFKDRYNKKQRSEASNFHSYSQEELEHIESFIQLKEEFSDAVFIREVVKRLENYGVGALLNKFRQEKKNAKRGRRVAKTVGVIISRFTDQLELLDPEVYYEALEGTLAEAGYYPTNFSNIWKNETNGQLIKLIVLPARHESHKVPTTWKSFKDCIMFNELKDNNIVTLKTA